MLQKRFKALCPVAIMATMALFAGFSLSAEESCSTGQGKECCVNIAECDSVDIPVFLVDGVEVATIDNLQPDDILSITVMKEPSVVNLFSPRKGGVIVITTKSKKYLTPLLQDYYKKTDEQRSTRIPGQLLIR